MSRRDRIHLVTGALLVLQASASVAVWVMVTIAGPGVFDTFPLRFLPRVFHGVTVQWWIVGLLAAIAAYGLLHWLTQGMEPKARDARREEAHAGMAALALVHFLGGLLVLLLDGIFHLAALPHWLGTVGLVSYLVAAVKFRAASGGIAVVPVMTVVAVVVGWLLLPAELCAQIDGLTR